MLGAIIGDIAGSRFEVKNHKSKDFILLSHADKCSVTDDSIMTVAVAKAILDCNEDYTDLDQAAQNSMISFGKKYPYVGYGMSFFDWLFSDDPTPYNSYGNGSAMRVSAAGFAARSLQEAMDLSNKVTRITHNHPEGLKGAEATAVAVYLAHTGTSIPEIREYMTEHYYPLDFTIDQIRPSYQFNESCQGTVPQALEAFLESTDFEDAIRNAVSVGGDSDTLAAITGGIAEAYYGIPQHLQKQAETFLDPYLISIVHQFEERYGKKI